MIIFASNWMQIGEHHSQASNLFTWTMHHVIYLALRERSPWKWVVSSVLFATATSMTRLESHPHWPFLNHPSESWPARRCRRFRVPFMLDLTPEKQNIFWAGPRDTPVTRLMKQGFPCITWGLLPRPVQINTQKNLHVACPHTVKFGRQSAGQVWKCQCIFCFINERHLWFILNLRILPRRQGFSHRWRGVKILTWDQEQTALFFYALHWASC